MCRYQLESIANECCGQSIFASLLYCCSILPGLGVAVIGHPTDEEDNHAQLVGKSNRRCVLQDSGKSFC